MKERLLYSTPGARTLSVDVERHGSTNVSRAFDSNYCHLVYTGVGIEVTTLLCTSSSPCRPFRCTSLQHGWGHFDFTPAHLQSACPCEHMYLHVWVVYDLYYHRIDPHRQRDAS